MKWLWAAYRQKAFKSSILPPDLTQDSFLERITELIESEICPFICLAKTPRGRIPVGMIFGRPFIYDMVLLGDFTWFPWASKRNIYESTVNAINHLRREMTLLFHVEPHDKEFAIWIARHGIARRVGTLFDVQSGPLSVFQSRPWAKS